MALVIRLTQILEFLAAKGQATEAELAQLIHASNQTLKTVIEQLNQALADVAVIKRDKKRYRLQVFDFDELALLLRGGFKASADFNSSDKRLAYICKSLIEQDTYLLMDDLADELLISRGTIQKDLKKLGQLVKNYDAVLESKPNCGIRLVASEFAKRLIFLNHVYDYYQYELTGACEFFEILDELYEDLHLNLAQATTLEREIFLATQRIKQNYIIENRIDHYLNFAKDNLIFNDFFVKIEDKLARNLTQYERDFMAYPLNMNNNFPFDKALIDQAFVNDLVGQMMQDIYDNYPIHISQEQLSQALKYHLIFLLNRTTFHYQEKNIFFKSISNRYPFAFQLAEIAQKSIAKVTGMIISEMEVNTLAIYFELSLSQVRLDHVKKIALVADVGETVKKMMLSQIQAIFGNRIEIEVFGEAQATQNFASFLAVFTTIPLKAISPDVLEIQVSNLLDDDFISQKIRKIKDNVLLRQQNIELTFTICKQAYPENLSTLIADLEKADKVDKAFGQRIAERNAKASTIFDERIAFPHAINAQADKIIISVAAVPSDKIQLIFLLAVPEKLNKESESDLVKVYDMIFEIIGDGDLQQGILQMTELQALQGLLKRKGLIV
jgi:lichenan operon transcriptional antiterminator